ncbi:PIN domain-containing protein [Cellulosilyticum lentocellum]|uniref:DUF4935 domain-containing protein n=1 Tax=Cellulosilyticum lentocellum (strain ATCC 49066 / DSM 5427 / NCIMB 11756 / RHM5) TaxID=642492 RepID=F2JQ64_CELLD|nr:hypothetical protein [Cellulosilyticum lentocellum]ADZ82612.1 hypothetical protein Clole_0879 [Cellulosilyticum lentocellum DSM 5427]
MIYIYIDTNIYIKHLIHEVNFMKTSLNSEIEEINRIMNRQNPLHELDDLIILCKVGIVKLLVPEVTMLELQKQNKNILEAFNHNYSKVQIAVEERTKKDDFWNEVKDITGKITNLINQERIQRQDYWERSYRKLFELFSEDYVQIINLTPITMSNAYKKKISGDVSDTQMNDVLIIEGIYEYLGLNLSSWDIDNDMLIIVSDDRKDFFDTKGPKLSLNAYSLQKRFVNETYRPLGMNNLKQVYGNINADYDIKINKDNYFVEFNKKYIHYINDEYFIPFTTEAEDRRREEEYQEITNQIQKDKNKKFAEKHLEKINELPLYIRDLRKQLIDKILSLLNECRNTHSWNNKSELKLPNELQGEEQLEIYTCTISRLLTLKEELEQDLLIHIKM